ncbi:MAG: metal-binding protein [Desulfovibrio sp.]|nr:metal-binding protein [Desulfovibrio sp.]MBI4958561.1 metal-binding protein [Desulfovibrio sp.]
MVQQSACQASHSFFQNRSCRYFPCHSGADTTHFNCLFCYCPLYFLEDCGGDFEMLGGIKDCSKCLKPHAFDGYERTVGRLKEELEKRREIYREDQER